MPLTSDLNLPSLPVEMPRESLAPERLPETPRVNSGAVRHFIRRGRRHSYIPNVCPVRVRLKMASCNIHLALISHSHFPEGANSFLSAQVISLESIIQAQVQVVGELL